MDKYRSQKVFLSALRQIQNYFNYVHDLVVVFLSIGYIITHTKDHYIYSIRKVHT